MNQYLQYNHTEIYATIDNKITKCNDEFILSIKNNILLCKDFCLGHPNKMPLPISYKNLIILLTYKKLLYG